MSKDAKKNNSKGTNYLALSFQMGMLIFLATYGGLKLDEITGRHHIFAILFSLLSIVLMLYYIIYKETHKRKRDD